MSNPNDLNVAAQSAQQVAHGVSGNTRAYDHMRFSALQMAIQLQGCGNAEGIVEDAKTFHKFLTGTKS